jgi:hypothetical protein
MGKILEWINVAKVKTDIDASMVLKEPPHLLKIRLKDGTLATIEPAYSCVVKSRTRLCTLSEGEVIYSVNKEKIKLVSKKLYDWLLVCWKYEVDGPSLEELLIETLYNRYYKYLGEDYFEYFMCPKIDRIERVRGDTRNHIIHASAVNYSGHHGGLYDKINFIVSDTVKDGIEILEVKMQKNISVEESIKQCK